MTITLICAGCEKHETHDAPWEFPAWYEVAPQDGSMLASYFCSEPCGASWLMRRQLKREAAGRPI